MEVVQHVGVSGAALRVLPMGIGRTDELRGLLGMVSGMIIGTLFTLFVVPSIYMLIVRTRRTVPVKARVEAGVGGLAEAAV